MLSGVLYYHMSICYQDQYSESFNFILAARIPSDSSKFLECCVASQSCMLLLYLKQQLKELYTLSDRCSLLFCNP